VSYDCGFKAPKFAAILERDFLVCGVFDLAEVSAIGYAGVTAGEAVQLTSTNGMSADTAAVALGADGNVTAVTLDALDTTTAAAAAAAAAADSFVLPSCFCGVFWRLIT